MKLQRIYRLHNILRVRRGRPIATEDLRDKLECSRSTLYRALAYLRDYLYAPVSNVPGSGYYYDQRVPEFELPGVWFGTAELEALLLSNHVVEQLQPGLLRSEIAELRGKIRDVLDAGTRSSRRFPTNRVRILAAHPRRVETRQLGPVITAVLERRKLAFTYASRTTGTVGERTVSPQRLICYRSHWYADCHDDARKALRTFAVDRMDEVRVLADAALDLPDAELDAAFTASYGIFAGPARHTAHLVFNAKHARWVADEVWHPDQFGQHHSDGSYELAVPYADHRELVGEILRHGSGVTVVGPASLVTAVRERLTAAAAIYKKWEIGKVRNVEGGKTDKLSEIGHGQVPFMGNDSPAASVSFARVTQRATVSFAQLRRVGLGDDRPNADSAARALLVAFGLHAHQLAFGRGFALRSGAELRPRSSSAEWLGDDGDEECDFGGADSTLALLQEAKNHARAVGVPLDGWDQPQVQLRPKANLRKAIMSTWPELGD